MNKLRGLKKKELEARDSWRQVILDNLAEGRTPEQIVRDYPPLKVEDVKSAISYTSEVV